MTLSKANAYRCVDALSCRACPLRLLRRHLSQRERLWQAGRRKKTPFRSGNSVRGFSFALASTMSTLISYAFIICHSPQKSSAAQKVYKRPLRLLRRHLSQRESLWRVGQVPTGRAKHDMAQKGGPCYRGQARLRTTSQSHSVRQLP